MKKDMGKFDSLELLPIPVWEELSGGFDEKSYENGLADYNNFGIRTLVGNIIGPFFEFQGEIQARIDLVRSDYVKIGFLDNDNMINSNIYFYAKDVKESDLVIDGGGGIRLVLDRVRDSKLILRNVYGVVNFCLEDTGLSIKNSIFTINNGAQIVNTKISLFGKSCLVVSNCNNFRSSKVISQSRYSLVNYMGKMIEIKEGEVYEFDRGDFTRVDY